MQTTTQNLTLNVRPKVSTPYNIVQLSCLANSTSNISIDKLSFTCNISPSAEPLFEVLIRHNPYINFKDIKTSLAEGQAYNNALYFKYDKFSPYSSGRNMRISFNPNKMTQEYLDDYAKTFLTCINNTSITRVDIAIDIEADLSSHYFYLSGIQKQSLYLDGAGRLETHYLGTRNSDRYIRLYNKKLELEQSGTTIEAPHLWRLECQLSNGWVNKLESCFDGLVLTDPDTSSLDGIDKLVVKSLIADPANWSELKKTSYYKYRKLIKELPDPTNLIPELESDYSLAIPDLLESIIQLTNLDEGDLLSQNKIRS